MTKYSTNIDSDEIMQLPLYAYEGQIVCVDTMEIFNSVKDELFLETLWGFDTETKPCFKKGVENRSPVALLQLSSCEKTYLFRLNKIGLPVELVNFLSSDRFLKVGVSVRDDIKALRKLNDFEPAGFIDLQTVVKKFNIEAMSLRKMAGVVMKYRISKAQQLSNWEAEEFTERQLKYAATDSWVSREIYLKLQKDEDDL